MFYGIEQSTDLRCKNSVVKKFSSLKSAKKWAENSGNFTYADPEGAKNYHHTFRHVYKLVGMVDRKNPIFKERGTSMYPLYNVDRLANYIMNYGEKL